MVLTITTAIEAEQGSGSEKKKKERSEGRSPPGLALVENELSAS
jgi:hypothetical protein